jgi:hypothetical protein
VWLAVSRQADGMAWLIITRAMSDGGTWQDAWVLVGPELTATTSHSRN